MYYHGQSQELKEPRERHEHSDNGTKYHGNNYE